MNSTVQAYKTFNCIGQMLMKAQEINNLYIKLYKFKKYYFFLQTFQAQMIIKAHLLLFKCIPLLFL